MTVQLDTTGPSNEFYRSTLFQATIEGEDAWVYGFVRTAEFVETDLWDADELVPVAFVNIAADQAAEITLTKLAGDIGTCVVYPPQYGIVPVIDGNTATFTLPAEKKVIVEFDGVAKNCIEVSCDPLVTAPTEGEIIIYNGTQLEAPSGKTLVFPAGVHNIVVDGAWGAKLFPVRSGAVIYFAPGSIVIGSLDLRNAYGFLIYGMGILSGEWITNEAASLLPTFEEQLEHSMLYGNFPSPVGVNNEVRNITVVMSPLYTIGGYAINRLIDVKIISPWTDNTDGPKVFGDVSRGMVGEVRRCLAWTGDDTLIIEGFQGNLVIEDNLLCSSYSSEVLFQYQSYLDDAGYTTTLTNNYIRTLCHFYDAGSGQLGGINLKCWLDAPAEHPTWGRYNVTIRGLHFFGLSMGSMMFFFGDHDYPWGGGGPFDGTGQMAGWIIEDVTTTHVPAEKSRIVGFDAVQTVHDVLFQNVMIAGTLLTLGNRDTYITQDPLAYNIFYNSAIDAVGQAEIPGLGVAGGFGVLGEEEGEPNALIVWLGGVWVGGTEGEGSIDEGDAAFDPIPGSNAQVFAKIGDRFYKVVKVTPLDGGSELNEMFDAIALDAIAIFTTSPTEFSRVLRVYDSTLGVETNRMIGSVSAMATPPIPYSVREVNGSSILASDVRIIAPASELNAAGVAAAYDFQLRQ